MDIVTVAICYCSWEVRPSVAAPRIQQHSTVKRKTELLSRPQVPVYLQDSGRIRGLSVFPSLSVRKAWFSTMRQKRGSKSSSTCGRRESRLTLSALRGRAVSILILQGSSSSQAWKGQTLLKMTPPTLFPLRMMVCHLPWTKVKSQTV